MFSRLFRRANRLDISDIMSGLRSKADAPRRFPLRAQERCREVTPPVRDGRHGTGRRLAQRRHSATNRAMAAQINASLMSGTSLAEEG